MARRRRGSRILLWAWAIFSMVSLVVVGVGFASSVPLADAADLGIGRVGRFDRLAVEILPDPAGVRTVAAPEEHASFGGAGDVVLYATTTPRSVAPLPFQNAEARVARALVHVTVNRSGGFDVPDLGLVNVSTVTLANVPVRNATGVSTVNLTVDLTTVGGVEGFLVKRDSDAAPAPDLVPSADVYGRAVAVLPGSQLLLQLALGVVGFLTPMVVIILSHRGSGRAGGTVAGLACPECGRAVDPGAEFCFACGANLPKG